ncbi:MAG TPA: hypothetical protein VMU05_18640, partial [Dongiaceae bacterium]|nr:hypothetical protein [Dongiaceae bacterium]
MADQSQATEDKKAASFEQLAERARAAMEADRAPDAIQLYAQATKVRPDWSEGWWHLGTLL